MQSVSDSALAENHAEKLPEYRSYRTVAQQLDISTDTIFRWLRAKRKAPERVEAHHNFPSPIDVGGAVRFVGHEIDAWLAERVAARDAQEVGDAH